MSGAPGDCDDAECEHRLGARTTFEATALGVDDAGPAGRGRPARAGRPRDRGLTRGCSFAPAGPSVDPGAGPTVDAPEQLRALAGSTPFALRVPSVPADWRANVVGTVRVGQAGHRAVRTGYVLPSGRYLRVVQSDADEAELLNEEARGTPVASGPVDVAGTSWVTYGDGTPEPIWIAQVGGARLLITGSGDDAERRTLAAATTSGEVLPR